MAVSHTDTLGKQAGKMLHQFAIILLATILGVTGFVDDYNTPGKLSPILYSKSIAILVATRPELRLKLILCTVYRHSRDF